MNKGQLQLGVIGFIVVLWGISAVWAALGSNDMLKVVTPLATLAFGWLYADKALVK